MKKRQLAKTGLQRVPTWLRAEPKLQCAFRFGAAVVKRSSNGREVPLQAKFECSGIFRKNRVVPRKQSAPVPLLRTGVFYFSEKTNVKTRLTYHFIIIIIERKYDL